MAVATEPFLHRLSTEPHNFLTPDLPLHTDVLRYLKHTLDPIAASISETQQTRLQEARKKRKRGQPVSADDALRLQQIYTDGFGIGQIWEQAKRVIAATRHEAELGLSQLREEIEESGDQDVDNDSESADVNPADDEEYDEEDDVVMDDALQDEDLDSDGEITNEALEDDLGIDSDDPALTEPTEEFVADKFGLNDGFFSIDQFNKQSEFLEQQDSRGDGDGAASDEEEVDWDANPLARTGVAEQEDEEEEDGPTFGDPDAASEDDMSLDGDAMDDLGGMNNTNEVLYADFFAPPAQKKSKKKKGRPNPHNFPVQEEDVQRTMEAVQRDLFEDESEVEEEAEELDPADPRSRKSTHERRKAALAEEIRKLEAANVAKREWALSGEARAADRPMNSLLEEDLEFERTGKPVPVITAEVSESIEELIKRRLLAHDFQDIPRRRPDDLATGKDGRRGRLDFTLDDTKSKKGLAEEYEEEHLRKTDPAFVDAKDEKLAKEQKEIEALWKDICGKLDSLSSWHFRPKQPTAQLDIRVDAPTVAMEDARPSAGGEVAAASQLAPQEIYKAGDGSKHTKEEVVGKSGLPASREELGRDEKKRRRRREKERIRKAGGNEAKPGSKTVSKQKQVLGDLKKGGVKVIGKKGQMTDVEGNASRVAQSNGVSSSSLKL